MNLPVLVGGGGFPATKQAGLKEGVLGREEGRRAEMQLCRIRPSSSLPGPVGLNCFVFNL